MDIIKAVLFGVIQGVTEFLPISSSGHLVVFHKLFTLEIGNQLAFDVLLHFATLLAVVFYFRKDIKAIAKAWVGGIFGKTAAPEGKIGWFILIGTLPAGLAGLLFEEKIEEIAGGESAIPVIIVMLALVGALFLAVERYSSKSGNMNELGWRKALVIGGAQSLALIPGTSRSGITAVAGLFLGLKREESFRFSFLLSIPVIIGANLKKIPALFGSGLGLQESVLIAAAFLAAFISGMAAIRYLLSFARNRRLDAFAFYRFALAFFLALWFL